jgi:F-type H+-transporting ATPase subunit b
MELINVPQLVTQVIGFLLVLFVLGRFAWPQVLATIDARSTKIAGDLSHAEQEKSRAVALREELDRELRAIEAKARARIQEAVSEGQRISAELRGNAQAEATARLQRVAEEIERERDKATLQLREDVVSLSTRAAEKILREKIDENVQRRMVEEFIASVESAPEGRGVSGR